MFRIILADLISYLRSVRIRKKMRRRGLNLAATSYFKAESLDHISCKSNCSVGDYTIIVIGSDPSGKAKGFLELESTVYIGEQCNIRASGGTIHIGNKSMIANHCVLVASGHQTKKGSDLAVQDWDLEKRGIWIGDDVWIGANCVILPGARVENGAVIGAGSVVRGVVKENSISVGVPARHLKWRE